MLDVKTIVSNPQETKDALARRKPDDRDYSDTVIDYICVLYDYVKKEKQELEQLRHIQKQMEQDYIRWKRVAKENGFDID
jgi:seryl-tRNA synthetase